MQLVHFKVTVTEMEPDEEGNAQGGWTGKVSLGGNIVEFRILPYVRTLRSAKHIKWVKENPAMGGIGQRYLDMAKAEILLQLDLEEAEAQ